MNITQQQVVIRLFAFMGIIRVLLFFGQLIGGSEAISLASTGFAVLAVVPKGNKNAGHSLDAE